MNSLNKTPLIFINLSHGMELDSIESNHEYRHNENGILFLVEYYILKYIRKELKSSDLIIFNKIVKNIQTCNINGNKIKGLYDRGEGESQIGHKWYKVPEKRRDISHDNLTAISVFSSFFNKSYSKDIARYAIKQQFRFDNCYPEKPRWFQCFKAHPRDWFCYLWHGGWPYRLISYPFFPIFFGACIVSCLSEYGNSSGKLLWFTRLALTRERSLLHRLTWVFYKKLMRRKYGDNWLYKVFCIYINKTPDHPLRKLSDGLIL